MPVWNGIDVRTIKTLYYKTCATWNRNNLGLQFAFTGNEKLALGKNKKYK